MSVEATVLDSPEVAAKKPVRKITKRKVPERNPAKKPVDAPPPTDKVDMALKAKRILQQEKKVRIRISSTETDKSDVFVAVNGHPFVIKRDSDVDVPMSVFRVLQDAKTSIYRQIKREDGEGNQLVETEVPRFSMSSMER